MIRRVVLAALVAIGVAGAPHGARSQTPPSGRVPAHRPSPAGASATPLAQAPAPGDSLSVTLLTVGQGDQIWELFGHIAIWIHDATAGTDSVYEWGAFDFKEKNFIVNFLQGRQIFSMEEETVLHFLDSYKQANRPVWQQTLNLTSAEKIALREYIRWNEQPENVHYRYDYFLDNCSTRVRDVIDRAVGGEIRRQMGAQMTGTTFRWHALRLMQGDRLIVAGVDIVLGRPTDRELSAYDESFLPVKFKDHLRDVTLDGGTRRLVGRELLAVRATRPPEPSAPPPLGTVLTAIGVAVAGLLAWVGARVRAWGRTSRLIAASLAGAWVGLAGIVGTIIVLLWTVTDHTAAYTNENLLLLNPLWLLLAVLLTMAITRGIAGRVTRWTALAVAALAILEPVLHILRLSRQDDLAIVGLVLPTALVAAWITKTLAAPPGVATTR